MSSFFGLSIAMKGLYASQNSIYVVEHNISNADTAGYSRQISGQKAATPLKRSDGTGMVGTGVDSTTVKRIRDVFLDNRYWKQNVDYGEWSVKSSLLSELESLMDETSENGLNEVLSNFSSSLEDLADNPESGQARAVVLQNGISLCRYLNNAANSLQSMREDYNQSVKIKVNEINSYAKQICDLNEQIYKAELDGSAANDLRDQRTLILDKLSKIADIEANEINAGTLPNGKKDVRFQVILNGVSLVNHFQVNTLECYEIDEGSDRDGMYGIRWANTGREVNFSGGEIKGYLDMRDGSGENGEYKGVTYYTGMLDSFARIFAKAFNEGIYGDGVQYCSGHAGGAGLDGASGIRFFSFDGKSSEALLETGSDTDSIYDNITAANISVSSDVEEDVNKIAAASISGEPGNNENISVLVDIFNDTRVFDEGMPEDYISAIVSTMGVASAYASRLSENKESVLNNIDNCRTSISGVSLDEETSNLIVYQQTYNAAAKMISVIDELLDVTINLGAD